jgi:ABC-2 type transport system ATP-binding protein
MIWLEFSEVVKSFSQGFLLKRREVIHSVSFSLKRGRTTGFVGANGSGKTTILKLALGFIEPDSGVICYPSSNNDYTRFKSCLGYLPERPYYYDFLTTREFLELHWNLGGGASDKTKFEEAVDRVLDLVKLSKEKHNRLRTFSKGMLQRIGIAQALLHEPEFLILDEPMSGLDPDGRFEIRSLLQAQKSKGKTLFFSSHLLEDVEVLCDDILLIANGRISFFGSIVELKQQMQSESLIEIVNQLKVGGRK